MKRKRKPPKNQRPYVAPGGKKRHLTKLTQEQVETFLASPGSPGVPHVYVGNDGSHWAPSHELQKHLDSTNTSGADQ